MRLICWKGFTPYLFRRNRKHQNHLCKCMLNTFVVNRIISNTHKKVFFTGKYSCLSDTHKNFFSLGNFYFYFNNHLPHNYGALKDSTYFL